MAIYFSLEMKPQVTVRLLKISVLVQKLTSPVAIHKQSVLLPFATELICATLSGRRGRMENGEKDVAI